MFPTTYRRLAFTAVFTLLGLGAASAATVPWSQLPLRVAPNAWARTAGTSRSPAWIAQAPETIVHAFRGIPDGAGPLGGLVADEDGSLYGTTIEGGLLFGNGGGGGTVFKLTPSRSGGYTESIIYRFGASGANDAWFPFFGGLTIDHMGALYGSSFYGGATPTCTFYGECGTIFKLTPTAKGYTESILHDFQSLSDGNWPTAPPILDRSGALYGTTSADFYGGGNGSIYKLTPVGSGYKFSVLYRFGQEPSDGAFADAALILDERTGDLYGTTFKGGINQNGIVFKLHPMASGYVYTIIYSFHGPDGSGPLAGLIMDRVGALYGTTAEGGLSSSNCGGSCGVAFKLTPSSGGYKESVLHYFTGGVDGGCPEAPLVADRVGTLYSTTSCGGLSASAGIVFKLVPTRTGYQEVTLHEFNSQTYGGPAQDEGVLLKGDYLLGELAGPNSGPYLNGAIYALKIPCDMRQNRASLQVR